MENVILYVAFGFIPVSGIASLLVLGRLYRLLRLRHPAVYAELGSPTVFLMSGRKDRPDPYDTLLLRFLYSKRYRGLGDAELRKLGTFLYWFWPFYLATLIIVFVVYTTSAIVRYAT